MENYEYIDDLGSGSYGFVWKCLQRSTGRIVAVKGFKLAHTDKKFLDQAIREVRMLRAACDHPNIVQLLEAFRSSSGRVYMVFEFVERCLSAELHKRFTCGLPAAQTRVVLWQLLCAVAHLHSKKIIHRDIKPGNLLMTSDGLVKLCDFGFARTTRGEPYQADRFSSYVVTRWYRSPEMLVSDLYSAASDVWSLGCTFAELATGRPLFPGTSSLDQLWRIMRCLGSLPPSQAERFAAAATAAGLPEPPPPPPRGKSLWQRLPELETRLLDMVQACLRLDPAQRPTAVQLLQMPYFWEIPKLIVGTPLEYLRSGNASGRPRTPSGRSAAQLQQREQQPAIQPAGQLDRIVSIITPNDLNRTAQGEASGATATGAGGGGGGRRNPPRQPSVLLSAVAASLLGELPPQHGHSGSVPLVPLAPPAGPPEAEAPAPAAQRPTQPQSQLQAPPGPPPLPLQPAASEGAPQDAGASRGKVAGGGTAQGPDAAARLPASGSVPMLPTPSRNASQVHVAVATVTGPSSLSALAPDAATVAAAPGTGTVVGSGALMSNGSVPSLPRIPSHTSGGGSIIIRSPSPSASGSPRPPSSSRQSSVIATQSPLVLPSIARPPSRRQRAVTTLSGSVPSAPSGVLTAVEAAGLKSAAPTAAAAPPPTPPPAKMDVQSGSDSAAAAAAGSGGGMGCPSGPPNALPHQQPLPSGSIAGAASVPPTVELTAPGDTPAIPVPSDDRAAPHGGSAGNGNDDMAGISALGVGGRSGSGRRGSGYTGGLQPGFGLLEDCDNLLSDGEGQISDDDELMEYFAGRQGLGSATAGGAAGIRQHAVTASHAPSVKAAGLPSAGHGAGPLGQSHNGNAAHGASSARRAAGDTAHAGVQAVHHSLYGSRMHVAGSSMPGMVALNRRVAAAALAGSSEVPLGTGPGSSPQHQRLQQLSEQSTAAPAKRATVGSYLPSSSGPDVALAKNSLAGLTESSATARPVTLTMTSASVNFVGEAGPSYKSISYTKPGSDAQLSLGSLPALGGPQHPPQPPQPQVQGQAQPLAAHGTTITGIGLAGQASAGTGPMLYARTSLPARGYGPVGAATAGSLTQYGTKAGTPSAGRRRALSRQGSVVFNQLMYDALPEIGTPGGAPDVPVVTPPRRRVVMSGFTPCRTAAQRAAAEGIPPGAAMAAVMGEAMQSMTQDISVPFSPIQGARSVDLLSPDHGSESQVHHTHGAFDGPGGAAGGSTAAMAMAGRRLHRRQGSAHFPEGAAGFMPGSSAGAVDRGPPYPGAPGGPLNGGPAVGVGVNPYGHSSATSDTGMLLGSSAPSYYRPQRIADAGPGGHACAGALSAAGPVPIPSASSNGGPSGNGSGRIPTAGSMNAVIPASMSPNPGPAGTGASSSRSGHPQPLTPAVRSRLASGNLSRMSDMSAGQLPSNAGAQVTIDGSQSIELDGFEGVGVSPSAAAGGGGAGSAQFHPYLSTHPAHHGAAYGCPGMGPSQLPMGGRGRMPRWAAGLIDSLPEDREVVHAVYSGGDWHGGGMQVGYGPAAGGPGGGATAAVAAANASSHSHVASAVGAGGDQGPDAIQMLAVCSSEWNLQSAVSGHQASAYSASSRHDTAAVTAGSAKLAGMAAQISPPQMLPTPRGSGPWPPAEPPRMVLTASDREVVSGTAPGAGGHAGSGEAGAGGHVSGSGRDGGAGSSRMHPFGRSRRGIVSSAPGFGALPPGGGSIGRDAEPVSAAVGTGVDDSAYVSLHGAPYGGSPRASEAAASSTAATARINGGAGGHTAAPGAADGDDAGNPPAPPGRKSNSGSGKWPRAKALLGGRLISSLVRRFKDSGASGEK